MAENNKSDLIRITRVIKLQFPAVTVFYIITILHTLFGSSNGHGRLLDPPARSSLWRAGFKGRRNYNDNQLNCGGVKVQWSESLNGKCGVCGDPYEQPQPRDNEGGGRYGRGVITRRYKTGSVVTAKIEITANHKGYFLFSLCKQNNPLSPASEDCFNKNILPLADKTGNVYRLRKKHTARMYFIRLRLPANLECRHCVFRWKWRTGNSWGWDGVIHGLGLGNQEYFFGCADISIGHSGGHKEIPKPTAKRTLRPRQRPPTPSTTRSTVTTCRASRRWKNVAGMDAWCASTCETGRPKCLAAPNHCCCDPYCSNR